MSLVFFSPHKFWLVLGFSLSDTLLVDMTRLGQQFVLPIARHICGIIFTSLCKDVEYILFFFADSAPYRLDLNVYGHCF